MTTTFSRRSFVALGLGAVTGLASAPRKASAADGVEEVRSYYAELEKLKKQVGGLSIKERFNKLYPIVARSFDLAAMAKSAIGPGWSSLGHEQSQVQAAFSRLLVASFAKRIGEFSGEIFKVEDKAEVQGGQSVVKTTIARIGGIPIRIDYAMRGGRIIDLYFNGTVSEVASRRAELAPILASGGSKALLAALEEKGNSLLSEA